MTDLIANLFDRVPERVFRPLGAVDHTRRNWLLLSHLYNDFLRPRLTLLMEKAGLKSA